MSDAERLTRQLPVELLGVFYTKGWVSGTGGGICGPADGGGLAPTGVPQGMGPNRDVHLVPVIRDTPREGELVEQIQVALTAPRFASTFAIVVADRRRVHLGR